MSLTHYIFVRRDLPIGKLAAMVTHAAGESAAVYEAAAMNGNVEGPFFGATAVVLEAKNEGHLDEIRDFLLDAGINHVEIYESGGDYHDQFMAIGVVPIERSEVGELMKPFQTLKSCLDNTPVPKVESTLNENTQIQEGSPGLVGQSHVERNQLEA